MEEAVKVVKNQAVLESIQQQSKALLRIMSAYKTASARALQVTAGILLEVYHACRMDEAENQGSPRARTIRKWQQRSTDRLDVPQGPKHLIPDLEPRVNCIHKRTDFHLT